MRVTRKSSISNPCEFDLRRRFGLDIMNRNLDMQERLCSRRKFLSTALAAPILATELSSSFQSRSISVAGPDGRIRFELLPSEQSRLSYRVTFRNKGVIEAS